MAEGLFRLRAAEAGRVPEVASAGFLPGGVPVPEEVEDVMSARGVDMKDHRSRTLNRLLVDQADLVLTMTRQHLLDVVVEVADRWTRCFTLVDALRRAEVIGPPLVGTDPARWVRQLHGGRTRSSLLSLDLADDITDPMNGRRSGYQRTAEEIDGLVTRLVTLTAPVMAAA